MSPRHLFFRESVVTRGYGCARLASRLDHPECITLIRAYTCVVSFPGRESRNEAHCSGLGPVRSEDQLQVIRRGLSADCIPVKKFSWNPARPAWQSVYARARPACAWYCINYGPYLPSIPDFPVKSRFRGLLPGIPENIPEMGGMRGPCARTC